MSKTTRFSLRLAVAAAVAAGLGGCEELGERISSASLPACESAREVAGWTVTAGLRKSQSSDLVVKTWDVAQDFSTFFGIQITYDTSVSPIAFLQIQNHNKSGEFVIRLPGGESLSGRLSAEAAVTTAVIRPVDVEAFAREPVQIEHTSHRGQWKVYQTTGLPEAMSAAEADLAAVESRLTKKECAF